MAAESTAVQKGAFGWDSDTKRLVAETMALGKSAKETEVITGVPKRTIERWRYEKDPDFIEAEEVAAQDLLSQGARFARSVWPRAVQRLWDIASGTAAQEFNGKVVHPDWNSQTRALALLGEYGGAEKSVQRVASESVSWHVSLGADDLRRVAADRIRELGRLRGVHMDRPDLDAIPNVTPEPDDTE